MSNLSTVLAFLQGKGLSSAQAAGVAGNWQVESGLRPTASNAKEGAVGVAQWEGGRRTALDSYAAATGGSETDLTTQLNFAWQELNTSEAGALHRLLATNDPGNAAAVFDQYYERSAGTSRAARVAAAQAIAAGQDPTGGATSPTGGATSPTGASGFVAKPAGLFSWMTSGWASDAYNVALKVGGGATAAALVVIGVRETVKGPK